MGRLGFVSWPSKSHRQQAHAKSHTRHKTKLVNLDEKIDDGLRQAAGAWPTCGGAGRGTLTLLPTWATR
eukprot:992667-Rhodomonas_salina.2